MWVLLAVVAFIFQWLRERGHPDFPPCPWTTFKKRRDRHNGVAPGFNVEEDEPLLSDSSVYGSEIPRLEASVQPVVDPI